MNPRVDLTDELLSSALRVDGAVAPADLVAGVRGALAAAAPRRPFLGRAAFRPLEPAWLLLILALLLAAMTAATVGSGLFEPRLVETGDPAPHATSDVSAPPTATPRPAPDGRFSLTSWDPSVPGSLDLEYVLPPGIELETESIPGVIGFAEGVPGLSYGWTGNDAAPKFIDGARGVVIADVTGATLHWGDSPPPAADAAQFLAILDAAEPAPDRGYEVAEPTRVEFAGFPGLAADVRSDLSYPLLEMGDASHWINLGGRSRLIVADAGERIILVQIWAGRRLPVGPTAALRDEQLESWIPLATEFVQSIVLASVSGESTDQPAAPGMKGSFALRSGDPEAPGHLLFDYVMPAGVAMTLQPAPGVVGFAVGALPLSYGSSTTAAPDASPGPPCGLVIADVTGATLRGRESPPADAADLFRELELVGPSPGVGYEVGQVTQERLAGYSAHAADVTSNWSYAFVDMATTVSLHGRSRLIAADVGTRIILVRVWAGPPGEFDPAVREQHMARCLPLAEGLLDSLVLVQSSYEVVPATPR